jgi:MoxR-like ATPase
MKYAIFDARYHYTGTKPEKPVEYADKKVYPYIAKEGLIEAVNLAIELDRPLLLKGEPGCGKSCLAAAVAYELDLPYFERTIKSTSRASDLCYRYEGIKQLRDANLAQLNRLSEEKIKQLDNPFNYITPGIFKQAFETEKRAVVLLDEIDKADLDFPNDLLELLEKKQFVIEEIGETIQAKYSPIIFLASNDERDLSDAFLRRCLVYFLEFPESDQLEKILESRFNDVLDQNLVKTVIERFETLREEMSGKKVSTSELIDWFTVLKRYDKDQVIQELNNGGLPFSSVLLKSWEDHQNYLLERGELDE